MQCWGPQPASFVLSSPQPDAAAWLPAHCQLWQLALRLSESWALPAPSRSAGGHTRQDLQHARALMLLGRRPWALRMLQIKLGARLQGNHIRVASNLP